MKILILNMMLWCHGSMYRAREIQRVTHADARYVVVLQNRMTGCTAQLHANRVVELRNVGTERGGK